MFVEERISDLQQLIGGQRRDIAGVAADNNCVVTGMRILGQCQGGCHGWKRDGDAIDLMDRHTAGMSAAQRKTQWNMGRAGRRLDFVNNPVLRIAVISQADVIAIGQSAGDRGIDVENIDRRDSRRSSPAGAGRSSSVAAELALP